MDYDITIIGGGLSGLMAASLLSKQGKKTLLLEQHKTVGGLSAGFWRKGYYFDSAMHCFMGQSTAGFYETLGIYEKLDFRPHRTTINIEGGILKATNEDELTAELCRIFPEEKEGILKFYESEIKKFTKFIKEATILGNPAYYSGIKAFKKYMGMLSLILSCGFDTLMKISKSNGIFVNYILKKYLKEDSKAYLYLCNKINEITYKGNFELSNYAGNWVWPFLDIYPYKGFQYMSDTFADTVKEHGGIIITGAKVKKIVMKNRRAEAVIYEKEGKEYRVGSNRIISAIDLKKTFFDLVGSENLSKDFSEKLKLQELSSAVPILYLGARIDREKVKMYFHGNEELYYVPEIKKLEEDLEFKDFYRNTSIRMASSCLINPEHAPDGRTNFQIYLPCPPIGWQEHWGIQEDTKAPKYYDLKKMVIEQVLEVIGQVIPELKDKSLIEVCELGTPYTIEKYTGNTEGSHGGLTWERNKCILTGDKLGKFFSSCGDIEGLFLIGHQTGYLGGVTNALWSAKNIANTLR